MKDLICNRRRKTREIVYKKKFSAMEGFYWLYPIIFSLAFKILIFKTTFKISLNLIIEGYVWVKHKRVLQNISSREKNIMCLGSVKLVGNLQSDTLVLSRDFKCRIGNAGIGVKLLHFGQHLSGSLAGVTFGWTATLNWFRLKTLSRQAPALFLILLVGRSPPVSSSLFRSHPGLFHWRFAADLAKFRI